jgi:outer membrane immunogenic protein
VGALVTLTIGRFFYVTGGLAYANIEATETSLGQGINASVNGPNTGWIVGTGIEWALPDPHWSVKAEYLYVSFDNKLYIFEPGDINRFVKLNENIVRVGLNYRFDWGKAPVVAKY